MTTMSYPPKTYVINLKSASTRWQKILKECRQIGISPIRIDGVLGKNLDLNEKKDNSTNFCARYCSPSAIGVAMSHIECWKNIVNNNDPYALILEDDCTFVENFQLQFQKMFPQVPEDFDILYVGCLGGCSKDKRHDDLIYFFSKYIMRISPGKPKSPCKTDRCTRLASEGLVSENVFVPEYPTGLHCYVISNKGARFLLSKIQGKIEGHIDVQILNYTNELNLYAFHPNLAYQDVSTDASTNLAGRFPRLLNNLFGRFRDSANMGLDYKFSINMYQFYDVPVNVYTLIFLLFGFISFISGHGIKLWYLFNAYMLVEFSLSPSILTLKFIIYSYVLFLLGGLLALHIFTFLK